MISKWIESPLKIAAVGIVLSVSYLVVDGTLWQYWTLQQSAENLEQQITVLKQETESLKFNIERAQATSYIERQATESLALVREGDLVFLFAD